MNNSLFNYNMAPNHNTNNTNNMNNMDDYMDETFSFEELLSKVNFSSLGENENEPDVTMSIEDMDDIQTPHKSADTLLPPVPPLPELEDQAWDQLLPVLLNPSDDFLSRESRLYLYGPVSNDGPKHSAEDLANLGIETQDGYVEASVLSALERGEHPAQHANPSDVNSAATAFPVRLGSIHPRRPASKPDSPPSQRLRLRDPHKSADTHLMQIDRPYTPPSPASFFKTCAPCRFTRQACSLGKQNHPNSNIPCERCLKREASGQNTASFAWIGFAADAFCENLPTDAFSAWWEARSAARSGDGSSRKSRTPSGGNPKTDKPKKKVRWAADEALVSGDGKEKTNNDKPWVYQRRKLIHLPGEVREEEDEAEEEEGKDDDGDVEMKDV